MFKKYRLINQLLASLVLGSSILILTQCREENLEVSRPGVPQLSKMADSVKLAATGVTSASYYLENALPAGYVRDGSVDYTTYLQAAVNKYSNVVFPGFPLLINDTGITISSSRVLTFSSGSELRMKTNSLSNSNILKIIGGSNITLYNPVLYGDRFTHTGTTGEWGMGIGLYGASDVTIINAKIFSCWGDGIYVGQSSGVNCKNIVIKDSYLKNNRRSGITIIGVDGLLLDNLYAGYNTGTVPHTGINFEPNNSTAELKNIQINNPRTEANRIGIQVVPAKMVGNTNKYLDITIVNHLDTNTPRFPMKIAGNVSSTYIGKLYGLIEINNPAYHKTAYETNQYIWLSTNQPNYKTAVYSPEIISTAGILLSWTATYDLLMKAAAGGVINVFQEAKTIAPMATLSPVFAVNAGGDAFTASDGIVYSADKSYTNGSTYTSANAINNTIDDKLYQSERYGNFSYSIPVSSGTYEITLKVSEVYHQSSGKRQFDILAENAAIVSDLDIFASAGYSSKYDIVKTVSVTDGTLNLQFRTDINHAKISAFHVIKK